MSGPSGRDVFEIHLESAEFPCEHLQVRALTGRERISRLYAFDVEIVCLRPVERLAERMLGAPVTIVVEHAVETRDGLSQSARRLVHGTVTEVTDLLSNEADVRVLRARVAPRMARLALVETQDIFLGTSVPDILAKKLTLVGLGAAHEMRLLSKYEPRDFVVQYNETDLAFVSRLAEHLGIFFFFEENDGEELLVFADDTTWLHRTAPPEELTFRERGEARDVFELSATTRVVPAYYAVRDYNDQIPHVELTGEYRLSQGHAGGVCEFGTHHTTPDEGARLARVRAEERLSGQLVYAGKSALPRMCAGGRYSLEGHPELPSLAITVVEVTHTAQLVAAMSGGPPSMGYKNTFLAVPAEAPYRPERITPKPRIHGLVHGIIDDRRTGSDQRAQLDEQGRYMVRFLFDTQPPGERDASASIRMVQPHAGEGYGFHAPLKPGTEVLVGFLHGDPDRPVIVGAVHNPLTPETVTRRNATTHRLRTSGGLTFDIVDDP